MCIDQTLYGKIRYLHQVEHLSQRQIAKQLMVSRHTVEKYMEGATVPDLRKAKLPLHPVLYFQSVNPIKVLPIVCYDCISQTSRMPGDHHIQITNGHPLLLQGSLDIRIVLRRFLVEVQYFNTEQKPHQQ